MTAIANALNAPFNILGLTGVNSQFIPAFQANAASGENDIYTVPAGKRALVLTLEISNPTGGSLTAQGQVKIAAAYYPLCAVTTAGAGVTTSVGCLFVLEAGEKFAVNTSGAGLNLWAKIVEYDAAVALYSPRVSSFSTGANTLYTVPAGKTAFPIGSNTNAGVLGFVGYLNNSGGSRTLTIYVVPSGGSAGSTNQALAATSVSASATALSTSAVVPCMATGDFIVVNVDAGTATQFAYVTIAEI